MFTWIHIAGLVPQLSTQLQVQHLMAHEDVGVLAY
jgi:hypothetical protein